MSFLLPGYDQYKLTKQMEAMAKKMAAELAAKNARMPQQRLPQKKPHKAIKFKPPPMFVKDLLHGGGKVPKTKAYRLKKGEVVMNKTQQNKLKASKTAAGAKKVLAAVAKKKPKK